MANVKLECLPILIVSAKDRDSAKAITSEIIDKAPDNFINEDDDTDRVWRLVNKYYSANVRLHALLDGQELESQFEDFVEAHLIYLTEDECAGPNATEVTVSRAARVGAAHVRVVAADAAEAGAGLAAACAAARLELVVLREAPADPPDLPDCADCADCGIARVRAAFHAHLWPGLVREGCDDSLRSDGGRPAESSDDEWSEWCAGPRADADAFATALGVLPAAAAAARRAGAEGPREERLARAEELVAAFCRALGTPLD